jgi:hypothetical protein
MELVFVVAGIALIWFFAPTLKAFTTGAEVKAQVMAEQVIADAVEERSVTFEEHKKAMEGKEIYSHKEIMDYFKV